MTAIHTPTPDLAELGSDEDWCDDNLYFVRTASRLVACGAFDEFCQQMSTESPDLVENLIGDLRDVEAELRRLACIVAHARRQLGRAERERVKRVKDGSLH